MHPSSIIRPSCRSSVVNRPIIHPGLGRRLTWTVSSMVGTQPTRPSLEKIDGAKASENSTAPRASGGRSSAKRIQPTTSALFEPPAVDIAGCTRRSTRLEMNRRTPCSSPSRSTHSSRGGMLGGGRMISWSWLDVSDRSPRAATTSIRGRPSCESVARPVVTDRPERSSSVVTSPGCPPEPGRRKWVVTETGSWWGPIWRRAWMAMAVR